MNKQKLPRDIHEMLADMSVMDFYTVWMAKDIRSFADAKRRYYIAFGTWRFLRPDYSAQEIRAVLRENTGFIWMRYVEAEKRTRLEYYYGPCFDQNEAENE